MQKLLTIIKSASDTVAHLHFTVTLKLKWRFNVARKDSSVINIKAETTICLSFHEYTQNCITSFIHFPTMVDVICDRVKFSKKTPNFDNYEKKKIFPKGRQMGRHSDKYNCAFIFLNTKLS